MKNTACVALFPGLASCAGSYDLPYIDEHPGVTVVLLETEQELPHACRPLGQIYAEDGWVESGRWAYEGTEERALQRLTNEALRLHGNYVVLERHALSELSLSTHLVVTHFG